MSTTRWDDQQETNSSKLDRQDAPKRAAPLAQVSITHHVISDFTARTLAYMIGLCKALRSSLTQVIDYSETALSKQLLQPFL